MREENSKKESPLSQFGDGVQYYQSLVGRISRTYKFIAYSGRVKGN